MIVLLSAVLLFFAQQKSLHYLVVQHHVNEHKDLCGIHKTQRHCTVCDYHFSFAIIAAPQVVDFIVQRYTLLNTIRFSYCIPAVIIDSFKRGPPFFPYVTTDF
ncbi:hypothetical protein GCM10009415_38460 [Chitinophaga japonensis]